MGARVVSRREQLDEIDRALQIGPTFISSDDSGINIQQPVFKILHLPLFLVPYRICDCNSDYKP